MSHPPRCWLSYTVALALHSLICCRTAATAGLVLPAIGHQTAPARIVQTGCRPAGGSLQAKNTHPCTSAESKPPANGGQGEPYLACLHHPNLFVIIIVVILFLCARWRQADASLALSNFARWVSLRSISFCAFEFVFSQNKLSYARSLPLLLYPLMH